MSQIKTVPFGFSFIDPKSGNSLKVRPYEALYNIQTGYITYMILRNLINRGDMFLQLYSVNTKPAKKERNRNWAKIITTIGGLALGFDELILEEESEFIDALADQGLDYLGQGAADLVTEMTDNAKYVYIDLTTGAIILDTVFTVS